MGTRERNFARQLNLYIDVVLTVESGVGGRTMANFAQDTEKTMAAPPCLLPPTPLATRDPLKSQTAEAPKP